MKEKLILTRTDEETYLSVDEAEWQLQVKFLYRLKA
jgi:hypothetical protein